MSVDTDVGGDTPGGGAKLRGTMGGSRVKPAAIPDTGAAAAFVRDPKVESPPPLREADPIGGPRAASLYTAPGFDAGPVAGPPTGMPSEPTGRGTAAPTPPPVTPSGAGCGRAVAVVVQIVLVLGLIAGVGIFAITFLGKNASSKFSTVSAAGNTPSTSGSPVTTGSVTVSTAGRSSSGGGQSSSFHIGDSFSAKCVIAWPSMPQRGTTSTTIRTTCSGVPTSQFQFVDITVMDPKLPVTPSRYTVQVRGEIMDIADSGLGFKVLVVLADQASVS